MYRYCVFFGTRRVWHIIDTISTGLVILIGPYNPVYTGLNFVVSYRTNGRARRSKVIPHLLLRNK